MQTHWFGGAHGSGDQKSVEVPVSMYSAKPGSSFSQRPAFEDVDEPELDENGNVVPTEQPRTSSSTARSRREQFFGKRTSQQRASRPVSGASQATIRTSRSRSKGKRTSQHDADDSTQHGVMPQQFQDQDDRMGQAEQGVRNFSKRLQHRRESSAARGGQPEVSALPPLPNPQRFSAATTAAPYSQDGPKDEKPPRTLPPEEPVPTQAQHSMLTELYTVSYLIFFSIFGVLARLGTQWIAFYPGAPITFPVLWANVGGSLMMGFLSEDQRLFGHGFGNVDKDNKRDDDDFDVPPVDKAQLAKYKKSVPLYIGLATGFCGSFTSFSSFARDVFLALSNNLPAPIYHPYAPPTGTTSTTTTLGRNGGYSFEALLAVMFSTIALSLGGLVVGAHTASSLKRWLPTIPVTFLRNVLDPSMVVLGWGCWLGAVLLSIFPLHRTWRGEVLFALVFAPLGTLVRFYASAKMNGLVVAFPLGTFAVNMFGTAVEGMCYDIQHVGVGIMGQTGGGRVGCQVLQGVMDGFCGCLTTVSTWVAEIKTLKRKHAYAYASASTLGGLCLMVIIMGSVRWTVGFSEPVCNTGYPSKVSG